MKTIQFFHSSHFIQRYLIPCQLLNVEDSSYSLVLLTIILSFVTISLRTAHTTQDAGVPCIYIHVITELSNNVSLLLIIPNIQFTTLHSSKNSAAI